MVGALWLEIPAQLNVLLLGKCVYEIAEHSHYVQGVAWDPLNEYIATQSSDRSMHIYRIATKPGGIFEVHAVGKNTRMPHRHSHSRTPSNAGRPRMLRTESMTSEAESSSAMAMDFDDIQSITSGGAPPTPALSVASTPSFIVPPPPIEASSRRSSFSSNAPGSPTNLTNNSRYGRSPSPMQPLPAIRSLPSTSAAAALWASVKLYGDESYTNFFRRLSFSTDGGLLLTPAGQFEDPSVNVQATKTGEDSVPTRGRRGHPSEGGSTISSSNSSSSVYIYSRANFARPPIAQLPGHKKASVAVRFSPILYELRPGVSFLGSSSTAENEEKDRQAEARRGDYPPTGFLTKGIEGSMDIDIVGSSPARHQQPSTPLLLTPQRTPAQSAIVSPTARLGLSTSNILAPSPTLSPLELRPPTPAASKPSTPVPSQSSQSQSQSQGHIADAPRTGSLFALPYRLLFSVITMDTVAIYDTQQSSPICLLTKLHYDEFTDMSW